MAKYEDSAAGWLIYRQHDGDIALSELNQLLRARGFRPVASRSMSHYRKLARLGYEEYISMNRLDIKHASDAVFDITDRSRYEDFETQIQGTLHLPTSRRFEVLEVNGVVSRVSEGFALLEVVNPSERVLKATRSNKYNRGVLQFSTTGFERAVQVSAAVEDGESAEILLTFRSLLSADLLFPERVGATGRSRLTVRLSTEPTMHSVVTAVHRSFDLFESARGIVETILTELPEQDRPLVASPRIIKLQVGSPLIQDLIGDVRVWLLVGFIIKWVVSRVKDMTEIEGNLQQIRIRDAEEQRSRERQNVEIRSMQLSNLKDELEIRSLLRSAGDELLNANEIDLDQIGQPNLDRLDALKNQAIEAAAELASKDFGLEFRQLDDTDSGGSEEE